MNSITRLQQIVGERRPLHPEAATTSSKLPALHHLFLVLGPAQRADGLGVLCDLKELEQAQAVFVERVRAAQQRDVAAELPLQRPDTNRARLVLPPPGLGGHLAPVRGPVARAKSEKEREREMMMMVVV